MVVVPSFGDNLPFTSSMVLYLALVILHQLISRTSPLLKDAASTAIYGLLVGAWCDLGNNQGCKVCRLLFYNGYVQGKSIARPDTMTFISNVMYNYERAARGYI